MNKPISTILLVAGALLIFVGGYVFGNANGVRTGGEAVRESTQTLLDISYPPPPDETFALVGVVRNVSGARMMLEVADFSDYLPHTDGTPQATEIRFASITGNSRIYRVDESTVDEYGNPVSRDIEFSEIGEGNTVLVRAEENIRDKKEFDVVEMELLQ